MRPGGELGRVHPLWVEAYRYFVVYRRVLSLCSSINIYIYVFIVFPYTAPGCYISRLITEPHGQGCGGDQATAYTQPARLAAELSGGVSLRGDAYRMLPMHEAAILLSEAGELGPDHFRHRVLGK